MGGNTIHGHVAEDAAQFSDKFDTTAPSTGLDMAGHDTFLLGPKLVILDAFVVDLLDVDTSAQTFRLKLMLNMDWEDDGTIEPEVRAKRNLGRTQTFMENSKSFGSDVSGSRQTNTSTYKTGKYVLKPEYADDPLPTMWNPEVVLVNAVEDGDPIEAGSKMNSVEMLNNRPVVSRQVLYQPQCRCEFTFSNFPFDETDLVVKFSSNKWNAEQVCFAWSHRLQHSALGGDHRRQSTRGMSIRSIGARRESSILRRGVDENAIGGIGLSEFEIIKVRVENVEKDVNSMQRYDSAEGAFSEAHLIIRVRRDPYSYLLRVAIVAEILMLLEVMSFSTTKDDLSARFGISGTNFLAMVSLYGPMADALPKVSVVTRVDKWHLFNFWYLFLSNVENLMIYLLRNVLDPNLLHFLEVSMAAAYLFFVFRNLMWFLHPLKEREEYDNLVMLMEDRWDDVKDKLSWDGVKKKLSWCVDKATPAFLKKMEEPKPTNAGAGFAVIRGATAFKHGSKLHANTDVKSKSNRQGILFQSTVQEFGDNSDNSGNAAPLKNSGNSAPLKRSPLMRSGMCLKRSGISALFRNTVQVSEDDNDNSGNAAPLKRE